MKRLSPKPNLDRLHAAWRGEIATSDWERTIHTAYDVAFHVFALEPLVVVAVDTDRQIPGVLDAVRSALHHHGLTCQPVQGRLHLCCATHILFVVGEEIDTVQAVNAWCTIHPRRFGFVDYRRVRRTTAFRSAKAPTSSYTLPYEIPEEIPTLNPVPHPGRPRPDRLQLHEKHP